MSDVIVSIAEDFSRYPAGRNRRDGENSAERFRDDVLIPTLRRAISAGSRVVVKLDGVYGYSSSFLEEVFGGLVRSRAFPIDSIKRSLKISADDPIYASVKLDAEKYLREEIARTLV
jgi:hypothetical protein